MSSKLLAALQHRKKAIEAATLAKPSAGDAAEQPAKPTQPPKPAQQQQPAAAAKAKAIPQPAAEPGAGGRSKSNKKRKHGDDSSSSNAAQAASAKAAAPAPVLPAVTPPPTSKARPAPQQHAAKKHKGANGAPSVALAPSGAAAAPASSGSGLSALQQKMASKLAGARFRWLNEKLYTLPSADAFEYFQSHPDEFDEYHRGFGLQAREWPESPLDPFIAFVRARPNAVVGDFGCGEARLAASVSNTVHSFDLVSHNPRVTACNMRRVPLSNEVLDIAVFCLSLMGTDFLSFLAEARRTLKTGGTLLIAEVRSRFQEAGIDAFVSSVKQIGFTLKRQEVNNQMFATFEFQKNEYGARIQGAHSTKQASKAEGKAAQQGMQQGGKGAKQQKQQPQQAAGGASAKKKGGKNQQQAAFSTPDSQSSAAAPVLSACIYKKR